MSVGEDIEGIQDEVLHDLESTSDAASLSDGPSKKDRCGFY